MNMNNKNLIIIFSLMVISGLVIYYLYLKPDSETGKQLQAITKPQIETFFDPTIPETIQENPECPPPETTVQLPNSIISRFFGIGFNIYPVNNTNQASQTDANAFIFSIEHIPIATNNTLGSMYALSSANQLTIKLRNELDTSQWWVLLMNETDSTTDYFNVVPFTMLNSTPKLALQYENGTLAIRPLNTTDTGFEAQKWISSPDTITRGIPVLNYNPASLFTPEFDPYSTNTTINSSTLTQQNNQQINEVINAIKTNVSQYLSQIGASGKNVPQVSASSLGNKDLPLNINVNLSGGSGGLSGLSPTDGSSTSAFTNVSGTTSSNDILSLLNKYETLANGDNNSLFTQSLQSLLGQEQNKDCPSIHIKDYTSNRVSSCNCKF